MSSSTLPQIKTKELYRDASDRVVASIYQFTNIQNLNDINMINSHLRRISSTVSGCIGLFMFEENNSYKDAILSLGNWLERAFEPEVFLTLKSSFEDYEKLLRRGLEILLMLLQRDLRRRILSLDESRAYHAYLNQVSKFRLYPKQRLTQEQVDQILDLVNKNFSHEKNFQE